MTKVGVLGSRGRMGRAVCAAVAEADGLELAAEVDVDDSLGALPAAGVEVAVDFTAPDAVMDNVEWCVGHGISVVVGTSGVTVERLDQVTAWLGDAPTVGVLVVPNFSVGAVLLMRYAASAAAFFESVEIVELHHTGKVDAPSGTARRTAEMIAAARGDAGRGPVPDATTTALAGARGAEVAGIPVHSVRLQGLVAHQEVMFGGAGETLTLRHDSLDRVSFLPGVVRAVRWVRDHPGLTVGLERVLELD